LTEQHNVALPSGSYQYDIAASIVVFHTDAGELSDLIMSLQRSSLSVRVTVVDNSSTDALRTVANQTGALYLYPGANGGFGKGHNLAMRETLHLARYHAVVNPDIILSHDTLERLYVFMEENPGVGHVMPAILNPDGSEQRLTKRLPKPSDLFLRRFLGEWGKRLAPAHWAQYELRDRNLASPSSVPCLSGCFMFLRSSLLEQVGLFDERYFMYMEDVDLCRRIGSKSKTMFFPGTTVIHGYSKGSYKNYRLTFTHLLSAIRYFKKWGWFFDRERDHLNRLL